MNDERWIDIALFVVMMILCMILAVMLARLDASPVVLGLLTAALVIYAADWTLWLHARHKRPRSGKWAIRLKFLQLIMTALAIAGYVVSKAIHFLSLRQW